ncbi:hypothetical protein [Leifsonia sp. SIMBA_070]|uniref:hypothetical protein n=1 Tax=Leifsonia sp. SIMBA_070 TaxID=3085810 RepID=UPI0039781841
MTDTSDGDGLAPPRRDEPWLPNGSPAWDEPSVSRILTFADGTRIVRLITGVELEYEAHAWSGLAPPR